MNSTAAAGVNYRFFSKIGNGVSSGNFENLNGSIFVGDDERNVAENLDTARKNLGADKIMLLKQIHGNKVLRVFNDTSANQEFDAMVTDVPGIAIAVLTADCAPVLMYDEENGVAGAAHAGWRGAAGGVIENTIAEMMKIGAKNIKAAIGPCIHEKSYSVEKAFQDNFPAAAECFHYIDGNLHFDLPGFCRSVLQKCGVRDILVSDIDTYASHDQYFSYRYARQYTNGICGRNISAVCLKKSSSGK